jgi:hypothetical protein
MAPKSGTKVAGGGYLDFAELTEDGPIVCVFHLVEFCDPEPGDYGLKVPVIADVLICDGDRAGEVCPGENIFGAPTGPLRGVKNPKKGDKIRDILDPVNELGDEITFRVDYIEKKGGQGFVALDPPSRSDTKTADEAYAALAERFALDNGDVDWEAAAEDAGGRPDRDDDEDDEPAPKRSSRSAPAQGAKRGAAKPAARAGRKPWGGDAEGDDGAEEG